MQGRTPRNGSMRPHMSQPEAEPYGTNHSLPPDTRLPIFTSLPVPAEPSHPHRILHDLINYSHYSRNGRFTSTAHATVLRQLFQTVWRRPECVRFFDMTPDESARMPGSKIMSDWLWLADDGLEKGWKLSEAQKKVEPTLPPRKGRSCGKILNRYDRTYSCKTCAQDASCVLCVDCFNASEHDGHEVLFGQSFSFAAACDCGDATAWLPEGNKGCTHHPPAQPGTSNDQPTGFVTDVDVPAGLLRDLYVTIIICLEFVINTMEHAPPPSTFSELPKDQQDMLYDNNFSSENLDRRVAGPWSVVLWADEKHVVREVTRQIRDSIRVQWKAAAYMVREMEDQGRKCLLTTADPVEAFHTASMLQQIDLGVSLRLAADVFREEIVKVIISWFADMCCSTIAGDPDLFKRLFARALSEPRFRRGAGHGTPLAPDLEELQKLALSPTTMHFRFGCEPTRLDWLMRIDVRFWRRAKWEMRQIYSAIYGTDWNGKKQIACRFGANYVSMFEHYLFHDRDLDTNLIFSIAYMIFGHGAACEYATDNVALFLTVIDVAKAWYTASSKKTKLIIPAPPVDRIDTSGPAFRGKKATTVFGHVRLLFRHREMQSLIAQTSTLIDNTVQLLHLFVGMQPQHRVLTEHVEYEVEWPRSFAILAELARGCREFGECFKYGSLDDLVECLHKVAHQIFSDMTLHSPRLDKETWPMPTLHRLRHVLDHGSDTIVFQLNVAQIKAFSFHHYLHLLLAELFKTALTVIPANEDGVYRSLDLAELYDTYILDQGGGENIEQAKLLLMEWPLQTHVVLSQIRAEMWKKNGNAMRGQYHHYRELNIREATLDQDFFFLQFSLCAMEPLRFFITLIDRFGLAPWFRDPVTSCKTWDESDMSPKQVISVMEDFVMLVTHLVTDTVVINGTPQTKITRMHIVHQLALNNLSYSELVKKIPERCTERKSLLPILNAVAIYREPTSTALGQYRLKDECFAEIDPFWRHYSRNEQRAATTKLLERAQKENPSSQPILKPRPVQLPPHGRPMSNLATFMHTNIAADIVYWIVAHCMFIGQSDNWPGLSAAKKESPQFDNLLDLVLHLAMVTMSVAPLRFAERSVNIHPNSESMSLFQNLWYMQANEPYKSFRPKIEYLLDEIIKYLPDSYTYQYRTARETERSAKKPGEDKAKTQATAAARQRAIMAEYAKKQADFAAMMMVEGDEDEDEEMSEYVEVEEESFGQCIVCQDDVSQQRPGGMLALIQPSRILRDAMYERDWLEESLATPVSLDNATRQTRFGLGTAGDPIETDGYPHTHLRFGVYVSACNHVMHDSCHGTYFEATGHRHAQQVGRHQPENAIRMEYLCPLCKSLGNVLIPLDLTSTKHKSPLNKQGILPTLSEKIRSVSEEGLIKIADSGRIREHHVETGELTPWFTDCNFAQQTLDPAHRRDIKPVSRMVDRIRNLLRPLSEQSSRFRGRKAHMYIPDDVVAYTVSVCEIAQRGLPRADGALSVAEQLTETNRQLIKKLIGVLQLELDVFFGKEYDRTALRVGIFARFLPDWYRASSLPSPLLLRNPLGIVIETAAIAPDLLHSVITMGYYATLTRVILGLSIYARRVLVPKTRPHTRSAAVKEPDKDDAMAIFEGFRPVMHTVLNSAGPFADTEPVVALFGEEMLARLLYAHTLPFLRRAVIVYHAVNSTYPDPHGVDGLSEACEYRRLMKLLSIPLPKDSLLNPQSTEAPIISRWLTQWGAQGRYVPPLEFPGTYELYRLPSNWEKMILHYSAMRCDRCGTKPTFPAVCLFCGTFLCLGGDCCAEGEQGECNLHMMDCGAAVGMFVDIKRWVILYLYAGSGSFQSMPYLDSHGELDPSLRRSHRQTVHVGRWDELRKAIWLSHAIPHLTARRLELSNDQGGWTCL